MNQQRAIIVGASSGIGRELAKLLSREGYEVGLCARRLELLEELKQHLPNPSFVRQLDVAQPRQAVSVLKDLVDEMGGVDLIVITAGTGYENPEMEWDKEEITIQTNVMGFTAIAFAAFTYFWKKGAGHIVGISSIAALRGMGEAPVYSASKAYVSNLLQGLRYKAVRAKKEIVVTCIEPGFVDTAMAKGEGLFWVASAEEAAAQIGAAMKQKRKHAYVTRRWRLMAWFMKLLPDFLYARM